jgi:nucleotide-binding universal stress UspA family protein
MSAELKDSRIAGEPLPSTEAPSTKLHLKTILVPTDLSEPARDALQYALQLADQFGSAIVLVPVVEPVHPYPVTGMTYFPGDLPLDPDTDLVPEAEKAIQHIKDEASRGRNVAIRTNVCVGRAYDRIVHVAGETSADLIVISTHGYTGLKHVLLGSTAEKVVRHAPCPVLVVRQRQTESPAIE